MQNNKSFDDNHSNNNVVPLEAFVPSDAELLAPQLDKALRRVLNDVPVPSDLSTRILLRATTAPAPVPWYRLLWQRCRDQALKWASVLALTLVSAVLLFRVNQPVFADELFAHAALAHTPQHSLLSEAAAQRELARLLAHQGGELKAVDLPGQLTGLSLCDIGGFQGVHAHFITEDKSTVTMIFFSPEAKQPLSAHWFKAEQQAQLLEHDQGLVAMVARQGVPFEPFAQYVQSAVSWPQREG